MRVRARWSAATSARSPIGPAVASENRAGRRDGGRSRAAVGGRARLMRRGSPAGGATSRAAGGLHARRPRDRGIATRAADRAMAARRSVHGSSGSGRGPWARNRWDAANSAAGARARRADERVGATRRVGIGRLLGEGRAGRRIGGGHRRAPDPLFDADAHRPGRHRRYAGAAIAPGATARSGRTGSGEREERWCTVPTTGDRLTQDGREQGWADVRGPRIRAAGPRLGRREHAPDQERQHRAGGRPGRSSREWGFGRFGHGPVGLIVDVGSPRGDGSAPAIIGAPRVGTASPVAADR